MNFIEHFRQQLHGNDAIPFADYMQAALYAPQCGYYTSGLPILGQHGDFTTAPELSPLFAQTLANQCQSILGALQKPVIVEFGAGTGRLCVELLKRLRFLDALPQMYYILDVSGSLKRQQQTLIQQEIPDLASRISWLTQWPEPVEGIFLANEVLDAMPVHRFLNTTNGILESYIRVNDQQHLEEIFKPCTNELLITHVQARLSAELVPYLSEANLLLPGWLQQCFERLNAGVVLLIDYGFPAHEYYHPDRNQGTLMCHYQHRTHTNPLIHPGEQDITAHVDFTHVAEAAYQIGFHVAGYTTQASFLLNNGLLDLLANVEPSYKTQQAIKTLIQPSEMGELFKVMALSKHFDYPLQGFQSYDKRGSL